MSTRIPTLSCNQNIKDQNEDHLTINQNEAIHLTQKCEFSPKRNEIINNINENDKLRKSNGMNFIQKQLQLVDAIDEEIVPVLNEAFQFIGNFAQT